MPNWCCESFDQTVDMAGKSGFSIIAVQTEFDDIKYFALQSRPFEQRTLDYLNSVNPSTGSDNWPQVIDDRGHSIPWNVSMQLGLQHCPYCGAKLDTLIQKHKNNFDQLASKHVDLKTDIK